jgi:hypothetical protein
MFSLVSALLLTVFTFFTLYTATDRWILIKPTVWLICSQPNNSTSSQDCKCPIVDDIPMNQEGYGTMFHAAGEDMDNFLSNATAHYEVMETRKLSCEH